MSAMMNRRVRVLCCSGIICTAILLFCSLSSTVHTTAQLHPPCWSLHGANETVVILKSGSTEITQRLPVHLSTTMRCYPNRVIFSDYEEDFAQEHVFNAIEDVSPDLLASDPEFELYRELQSSRREQLQRPGLSKQAMQWQGNLENPGWKLDKWKFLPMVNRTLHEFPDMKWYVFVEADTYLLWSTLLHYLSVLDHTQPVYLGSQMYIGDVLFAHGGSGFVVSQSAMRKVVSHYAAHKSDLEAFAQGHWAGDAVLGKAFTDSGVKFTDAWPIMQGDYPGIVAYAKPDGRPIADPKKRVWCYPTVSYHHLSPETVEDMWNFEQQWIKNNDASPLRHKDIFREYILPRMAESRVNWDNESDGEEGILSFQDCRSKCEATDDCRQFSVDREGLCRIRSDPRLGKASQGAESGWIEDRMTKFEQGMEPCGSEDWLT